MPTDCQPPDPRKRKSFTLPEVEALLRVGIPQDRRPALWMTGLTSGLRPGELVGLRWPYLDIDSDEPCLEVAERAAEVQHRYVGQAPPKTARKAAIGLHPLAVAALRRHRDEMIVQGLYDPEGFVFCTRNGTPISVSNLQPGADGQHRLGAVHRPRRGRVFVPAIRGQHART